MWFIPFPRVRGFWETTWQSVCKDDGPRGQQAAGDDSDMSTFRPSWPPCPAYLLSSLWANGTAPSTGQALARAVCYPKSKQELSEQSQLQRSHSASRFLCDCSAVWFLKHLNSALVPAGKDSGTRDVPKLLPWDSTPNNIYLAQNTVWQTSSARSFYCGHQLRGPRSHRGSASEMSQHLQRQSQKPLVKA